MDHFALGVEYDGHVFHGFQVQKDRLTVQSALESALSQVANHPVKLVTAGRTDAGVHATAQVVSFSTEANRGLDAWVRGINSLTPDAISIIWVRKVDDEFSARFTALSRRYLYVWHRSDVESALVRNLVTHTTKNLDVDSMESAVKFLLGEQDFSSFRASGCQSRTAQRRVIDARVHRFADSVVLDICANAFLQHMVRNIAGSLFEVGVGNKLPEWIQSLLNLRDRKRAAATASPKGLYLVQVRYPERYKIPDSRLPIVLQGADF